MQENEKRDATDTTSIGPKEMRGRYLAGRTTKKKIIEPDHPENVWLLEYYHDGMREWLYVERGRGVPFGPWKMERAIHEMASWAKSTKNPKWSTDGVEWRIRNVMTEEVIPHNIFPS